MKLTEEEKSLVLDHRAEVKVAADLAEKQKVCKHEWYYAGHGHNDDAYECHKCGDIKWV
jgi:hypothetical protein